MAQTNILATSRHFHQQPHQDKGVPHAVEALLQPQPPVKHHGSTILLLYALSHTSKGTNDHHLGIHHQLRYLQLSLKGN